MKDKRIINDLIVEYFRVKHSKNLVVSRQEYENAARLRDKEKKISDDFYRVVDDEYKVGGVVLCGSSENTLKNYCNINYPGLSDGEIINHLDTIKSREQKFKDLGL